MRFRLTFLFCYVDLRFECRERTHIHFLLWILTPGYMGAWVGVRACVVVSACCTFDYRCWPFAWHLMRFGPDLVCQWHSLIVAIDATVATSFADSQRLLPTCHFPLATHNWPFAVQRNFIIYFSFAFHNWQCWTTVMWCARWFLVPLITSLCFISFLFVAELIKLPPIISDATSV